MKFIYKNIILTGFICLYTAATCNAQSGDSITSPADYSLLPIQYTGLQTSNPVAYIEVDRDRMNGQITYNHTSGDYKYISDPRSMNSGQVALEGFKRVNKLHFYGSFSYNISGLKGQKWKDVLMPSQGNPFILGDSIGGDYDNERFAIKGVMASTLNKKLKWAVAVDYNGGSSADQSDPRPRIDATRYSIYPGIMYNLLPDWSIGLDFGYEGYKEVISVTTTTKKDHNYFLFQGLGNYTIESGISHGRQYKGTAFGSNAQIKWRKNIYENILQLGYKSNEEKSEDGAVSESDNSSVSGSGNSNMFRSGDYKETIYSLMNIFSVKQGQTSHILKVNIDNNNSKGIWYDQKKITNSNNQQIWEIYNKSVKYKNKTTKIGLDYIWLKERSGWKDYMLGVAAEFEQHKTTLLPDMHLQKYSNVNVAIKGGKTFRLPKNFQLGFDLKASYQRNLSSKADFTGLVLANLWSYPVFEYLTSDHYRGDASFKLSKQTRMGNLPSTIYLTAGASYTKSALDTDNFNKPDRIGIATSFGFTF